MTAYMHGMIQAKLRLTSSLSNALRKRCMHSMAESDAFPPWRAALAALRLPFLPPEFAFGLAVFCCMPTTLSSGVSLTQV